jgi:hypothetical protein
VPLGAVLERARCVGGRIHHISVERTATPPGCRHADPLETDQPIVKLTEFVIGRAQMAKQEPATATLAGGTPPRLGCVVAGAFRKTHPQARWWRGPRAGMIVPANGVLRSFRRRGRILKADRLLSALIRSHRKGGAWVVGPAALAALAAAAAGSAWAQNPSDDKPAQPSPGTVRSSPLPAPVGHRQPRASDIPPPSPGDNTREAEPRDDLNERLRICRGC